VIPRIGPITVSCHSSSVWFLVSLLLPLLFLLLSTSDRLQVLPLYSSTKLDITKEVLSVLIFDRGANDVKTIQHDRECDKNDLKVPRFDSLNKTLSRDTRIKVWTQDVKSF
jgi:hypothetical protein